MRLATSRGKPACHHAHGNKTWQHSSSHSNAICNQGFHNRKELRTHEDTQSAEHHRTPREHQKTSKRVCPQPPHTRAALHRRLQPLYTEKHKVSCQHKPHATFMQPLQCLSIGMCCKKTSHHPSWCIVMGCKDSHHPSWCIVMFCTVSRHPSWCIVMCFKVSRHLSWCIVMWCKLLHRPLWCIAMWCKVTWIKVIRNLEDCFPTSFDNLVQIDTI